MDKIALIAGSTGLVGGFLVRKLLDDKYFQQVISLSRRESSLKHEQLNTVIVDFSQLAECNDVERADIAFCCLGTTMKKAGSKPAFFKVDHDYVLAFARYAKQLGCRQFLLVSAMGADQQSLFYYNRVKGKVEAEVQKIGFDTVHILRPSLLLGERNEKRLGEDFGKLFMQTFNFLIPQNYKGIQAEDVASHMQHLAKHIEQGTIIHESSKIRLTSQTSRD